MPTKFRKNVWIKRGDFCIVDPIQEGDKVKAEIVRILYKEQIRQIKLENLWPFKSSQQEERPDNEADEDTDLFENPNRAVNPVYDSSSSSEEEEED